MRTAESKVEDPFDEIIGDLAKELGVSKECASNVRYLRSRSRWTQELEDELIRLHKEGNPPNMNEFGCDNGSALEAELEKKYGAKK